MEFFVANFVSLQYTDCIFWEGVDILQFNSIEFLFCFFPLFLIGYYAVPVGGRNFFMVAGSLVFYAISCAGNYWWLGLLVCITLIAYVIAMLLAEHPGRGLLLFSLGLMLGVLILFKLYQGGKLLPVGISFYLFQLSAYIIDVYRGRLQSERKLMRFFAQIFMFPKLLSGPLMDPRELQVQSQFYGPNREKLHGGLQVFILGLCLKVLVANRLGGLWNLTAGIGYENISPIFAWMVLLGYALQLYFDFYGYSLMAVGIGKMLGYDLPQNFLTPYASKTVSEFYRRWHATLGAWFREYLYFPLGGSRKGTLRTIFNLAVVWLFTGLWHGIGGNYLVWAGFLFLLIVNERLWLGKLMKKSHVLCHVYVPFVILLSWVPFAIGDWQQMVIFLGRLFNRMGSTQMANDFVLWGKDYFGILSAGVILATPLPQWICRKVKDTVIADLVLFVLFWVVVYFVSTAAQDPFMYFQY